MKNVLLLGATGTAGSAPTKKLPAETDCGFTLFARHARDMYTDTDRISVINGNAENIVSAMYETDVKRLIFMGAVAIYNEIPDEIDGEDNLDNEPAQIPNRKAVDIIEASDLNYTILRPGYLGAGSEDDFVLTLKGEAAKGYTTAIPALAKFAVQLILDDDLYSKESVSITHDATKAPAELF